MAYGGNVNTDILSDETYDLLCIICKRKDRNQEAEKYCMDCRDYYCLKCVKVHEDVPSLAGHKIFDKSQFPSSSIKTQPSVQPGSSPPQPAAPTERCDRHSHHYIDMYCQNHDDVGCGTCMAADHRLCQDIFYIPEFLQNNPNPSHPKEIQQTLDSAFKTLNVHHENLKREKQHLLDRKDESLENIRKFRKDINDRLDELERNTVADIEDEFKILINKIEEVMKLLETNKVNVTSAQDQLASAGNVSQNFVNTKKGKQIARNAAKCLEKNKASIHMNEIDFILDQRILALFEDITTLGHPTQRSTGATGVTGNKETLLKVKGSKKYYAAVFSDSVLFNSDIVSACTLQDGTIILSDRSNKKLKRLDSSTYTVKDYCDLTGLPWQVCPINKQEVAVCYPDNKEVTFIEVKNVMTIKNKIETDFRCCGLAHAGGNLYISDAETSVYVYSVLGRKLKQFSKDQNGQAMFSNIRSLAVNEDGSRIYVTDFDKGLIVLDNDGQVVGKFNGSQLKCAWGSYITGGGSLLVTGYASNNVLQFGLNGELIGEVAQTVSKAKGICCNQQMSKIIIGSQSDKIDVYDLL